MASMDWAKTTARGDKKHLSFGIWCDLYWRFYCKFWYLVQLIYNVWRYVLSPTCTWWGVRYNRGHASSDMMGEYSTQTWKQRKTFSAVWLWGDSFTPKISQGSTLGRVRIPGACRSRPRAHKLLWLLFTCPTGQVIFRSGHVLISQQYT